MTHHVIINGKNHKIFHQSQFLLEQFHGCVLWSFVNGAEWRAFLGPCTCRISCKALLSCWRGTIPRCWRNVSNRSTCHVFPGTFDIVKFGSRVLCHITTDCRSGMLMLNHPIFGAIWLNSQIRRKIYEFKRLITDHFGWNVKFVWCQWHSGILPPFACCV